MTTLWHGNAFDKLLALCEGNPPVTKYMSKTKKQIFRYWHSRAWILFQKRFWSFLISCEHYLCSFSGLNNSIGPIARDCPKWPSGDCIYVRSCPPNLCGWIFGQPIFFLYQTTAQYPLTMVLQKILYWTTSMLILSMISYPLYSIYCILGSYHHCTGPFSGILMTKFEKHYSISNG